MRLGEICNREVVIIGREGSIREAARLMRDHHVGDVVVVDKRAGARVPVGILTDRDIVVEIIAAEVEPTSVCVGDVMSDELVKAGEGDDAADTLKLMRERGIRRIPVVDAAGALAGIVTVDDLLDLVAEQMTDLVNIVANEQSRERRSRT